MINRRCIVRRIGSCCPSNVNTSPGGISFFVFTWHSGVGHHLSGCDCHLAWHTRGKWGGGPGSRFLLQEEAGIVYMLDTRHIANSSNQSLSPPSLKSPLHRRVTSVPWIPGITEFMGALSKFPGDRDGPRHWCGNRWKSGNIRVEDYRYPWLCFSGPTSY